MDKNQSAGKPEEKKGGTYTYYEYTNAARSYHVTGSAKFLLMYIVSFVNHKTGLAWPSMERLMSETGLSRGTVFKFLKKLKNKGTLTLVKRRQSNVGVYKVNIDVLTANSLPKYNSFGEAKVECSGSTNIDTTSSIDFDTINNAENDTTDRIDFDTSCNSSSAKIDTTGSIYADTQTTYRTTNNYGTANRTTNRATENKNKNKNNEYDEKEYTEVKLRKLRKLTMEFIELWKESAQSDAWPVMITSSENHPIEYFGDVVQARIAELLETRSPEDLINDIERAVNYVVEDSHDWAAAEEQDDDEPKHKFNIAWHLNALADYEDRSRERDQKTVDQEMQSTGEKEEINRIEQSIKDKVAQKKKAELKLDNLKNDQGIGQ